MNTDIEVHQVSLSFDGTAITLLDLIDTLTSLIDYATESLGYTELTSVEIEP